MRGIILAAGRGSRLKNMTLAQPKGMVKLGGKSLLEWQISAFKAAGIHDIAIVKGYRHDDIQIPETHSFVNHRWEQSNMVRSLTYASEWLNNSPCIVSYADIIFQSQVLEQMANRPEPLILPYNTEWLDLWQARFEDPLTDAESFKLNALGQLIEIGKKTQSLEDIEGQYMGLIKFTPQSWHAIEKLLANLPVDRLDMTGLLQAYIENKGEIHTFPYSDLWLEVDDLNDLELYQGWLLKNKINLERKQSHPQ